MSNKSRNDERVLIGGNENKSIWDSVKVDNRRAHVNADDPYQISHFISHADLSVMPLSFRTSGDTPFKIVTAILRASQGIRESVGLQLDSRDGSQYDTTFASGDFDNFQDFYWPDDISPGFDHIFQSGDQVLVTCSNNNASGDVFATITTRRV